MSLAAQDLSLLLEGQGDHFPAGVALEVDLGTNGLNDEDILIDGRDLERTLVGTLDKKLDRPVEKTRSSKLGVSE